MAVFQIQVDASCLAHAASALAGKYEPGEAPARWMPRYVDFISTNEVSRQVFAVLPGRDLGLTTSTGQCTHRRVGVYCRLTGGWRPYAQGQHRSAYPLGIKGLESRFPTRPICPDCPKTLDQFDIRFPASPSFTSYPIACEAVQFCTPRRCSFPEDTRHFPIGE